MIDNILRFILIIYISVLVEFGLFYITEKIYCKKYYRKELNKCKCWSCRFYNTCKYSKGIIK